MIDTDALRKKVIELAVQGKLTERYHSDGDAESLYSQIQVEKAKLAKEGKIRKEKPLSRISDDEIPYEIPKSWKWCRLGEVYCVLMGQSPEGINVSTDIDGMEFHQGKIYFGEKYLKLSEQKTSELTRVAEANSVLLCVRAPVGVVNITQRQICIGRGLCALSAVGGMDPYYLFYYLLSCRKSFEQSGTGSTFSAITVDVVKKHLIPIPPIEEQQRIVALLENVFNQFTVIDTLQQQYESDLAVLKGKIIDAGIRGKLTEQLPEDGDAETLYSQIQAEKAKLIKEGKIKKEKPLPEIEANEILFEIPKNWKWVRISDVIDVRDGTHDTPKYVDNGYPLITGKDFYNGYFELSKTKYITREDYEEISKRSKVDIGDILYSMIGGNIGSMIAITKDNYFDMAIKNVALFKQYDYGKNLSGYLQLYLKSQVANMRNIAIGGAQSFVPLKIFRKYPFPLPPLNEQARIVEKINSILDCCGIIKK